MAANNYQFDATGTAPRKTTLNWNPPTTYNGRPVYSTPDHIQAGSNTTAGANEFYERNKARTIGDSVVGLPPADDGNINPFGGIRTDGGGGRGGGYSAPSTPDYGAWLQWATAAKPDMLDLPDYKGTGFYDFDSTPYTTARQGIQTGISDARTRGNTAFNLAAQRYLDYQDPYAAGPKTYNPGVDPRLMDSMAAWGGAGSDAALGTYDEGVQADAAMQSVYDLLGAVGRQFNDQQLAGIEGDRMQLDQRLGSEERMLNLSVDMALAQAKSQYEKDRWQYGEEIARMNYEKNVAQITANTTTRNQWNQDVLDQVLGMISSQGRNIPTSPGSVMF